MPSPWRELARRHVCREVVVHGLLDGRDTPPRSAESFVPDLEARLRAAHPGARIATHRRPLLRAWIATSAGSGSSSGYEAIVHGVGLHARRAPRRRSRRLRARRERRVRAADRDRRRATATMRDGDVVIHFNFRADRARQLTHALVDGDEFDRRFDRGEPPARPARRDHDRVRGRPARRRWPSRRWS